jgi:hypothetical protein
MILMGNGRNLFYMGKRLRDRVMSSADIYFYNDWVLYSGVAVNVSENGMFIVTENNNLFPESQIEVFIPVGEKVIYVPAKLIRINISNDFYDGIGIELLYRPDDYSRYVKRLRNS